MKSHAFPSAADGRFLFGLLDEDNQFEVVRLKHGLAGHRDPPTMHRCAGGVHLLELRAPEVNRVEYRFDVLRRDGEEAIILDPLNPYTVRDPFAEKSVVATDAYQPPAYMASPPPSARGTLDETVVMGPLGKSWPTWIWQPPAIASTTTLPVILVLDGGDWLQIASAHNILENLLHAGAIAPCRAVFTKPAQRNEEYAANPRTAAALAEDIPRQLAEHIPWPQEPTHRIAVGVSLGGLCLLHAHVTQAPHEAFGGLILQSGSFFQPQTDAMETGYPHFTQICSFVSQALAGAPRAIPRIPIHMTCGAGEENIVNNRIVAEVLRRQGVPLTFAEQPDAHNWTCWRDSIGEGLKRLLAP